VVLKVLDPAADRYRKAAFEREIALMESLNACPEVARILSPLGGFTERLTTSSGLPLDYSFAYFAMELAEGSIEDFIAGGGYSAENALMTFRTMCRAVRELHRREIAHRDLKPGNFLTFPRGVVKLSDLGAARPMDVSSHPLLPRYSGPPGDIRYLAPEMVASLHDPEPSVAFGADFYSLGAILFELCTGMPLVVYLFDLPYLVGLRTAFGTMDPTVRRGMFDSIIDSVVDSHPLPSLRDLGSILPRSVAQRVDDLYRSLSALDARARLVDFDRVLRQIEICMIVLRHERLTSERLAEKRARRARGIARRARKC